jgi:hypothetical protein
LQLDSLWRHTGPIFRRGAAGIKSFERELAAHGGVAFRVDLGIRAIPTAKVVGSVGRSSHLRHDFFEGSEPAASQRYARIGRAMRRGTALPALEVYELRAGQDNDRASAPVDEYYVVDGHHRVAMAKKLGVDFLDAHVVLYRAIGQSPDDGIAPASAATDERSTSDLIAPRATV